MARQGYMRGAVITAVGNFIPPLAAFATAPILAHALGVVGRGEVSAAQAPMLLMAAVFTLGLPEAATYFVARSPRLLAVLVRRGSLVLLGCGLLATACAIAVSGLLAGGDQTVAGLISISALAIAPTLLLGLVRATALGLQAWWLVALERTVSSVLRLGILLALLLVGQLTVVNAVYVNAWYLMLGGLVYLALLFPRLRRRLQDSVPHSENSERSLAYRRMLGYGMGVWFGSLAGVLLARVDQVLIVPLSGTYELGLYAVAVAVAEIPLLLNNTVREVMFAADARARDDARLTYAARMSGLICLVAAIAIGATMWWWLPILFGNEFSPALTVTALLLVAVCVGPPGSLAGAGLAARGLPKLRSLSLLVALVVNVGLVLLLVPPLGAAGAALATLVGNVISSNLNIWFASRSFGIPFWQFYRLRLTDIRTFASSLRRLARRAESK